ncbi:hypothetical protein BC952_1067 [Flavobacterium limicola]|uniref:Uncharacterized protein n=1 Tax=Flavobacterium limicola TaxID=180441 RepID=A0A495S6F2_9FLAO|nr:hypothetical protein BC952_1067 [Flavobacterium limicola]
MFNSNLALFYNFLLRNKVIGIPFAIDIYSCQNVNEVTKKISSTLD